MKYFTSLIKNLLPYRVKRMVILLTRFFFYRKTIVVILSSMRAGSTLLKTLIAEAPETSHLPETDFRKYYSEKHGFSEDIYQLSKKRILVLKYPYAFHDMGKAQPCPRGRNVKVIVLVRDVYSVVKSIMKRSEDMKCSYMTKNDFVSYWCETYETILKSLESANVDVCFIRYEDLTSKPIEITSRLFRFIGSKKREGVQSYHEPEDFEWRWGFDDGGENIRNLKVIDSLAKPEQDDEELLQIIEQSLRARTLRNAFGYIASDTVGVKTIKYVSA